MNLDEATLALIKETFEEQKCCKCQDQAFRMARRKFYCADHYPVPCPSEVIIKMYRHPKYGSSILQD